MISTPSRHWNQRSRIFEKCQNHAWNRPFPLRHVDFHLTHEWLATPLTTPNDSAIALQCMQFHTTTQQIPHWLQWVAANSPRRKLPLPLRRSPPKSNKPLPSPTPLTTLNGIRIQSAVLPHVRTDGRGTTWSITLALCSAILIASDALIISGKYLQIQANCPSLNPLPVALHRLEPGPQALIASTLPLSHRTTVALFPWSYVYLFR